MQLWRIIRVYLPEVFALLFLCYACVKTSLETLWIKLFASMLQIIHLMIFWTVFWVPQWSDHIVIDSIIVSWIDWVVVVLFMIDKLCCILLLCDSPFIWYLGLFIFTVLAFTMQCISHVHSSRRIQCSIPLLCLYLV